MWPLLCLSAFAAPQLLPSGSTTLYGGVGLSSWTWGMSGLRRDPAGIARLDTWVGHGLSDHVQVSGGVPLAHGRILVNDPDLAPCPSREVDYCRPVTAPGDAHLGLHAGSRTGLLAWRVGVGLHGDPWTAPTRTRYVNVGQGTVGGALDGSLGLDGDGRAVWSDVRYLQRFGRLVPGLDLRAPADALQLAFGGRLPLQRHALSLVVGHHRQLKGVDYGPAYLREVYPTAERWGAVAFRQWRAEAKLSLALSDRSGLHLAASRALHTRNGPRHHSDLSVGAHLWIP